MINDKANNYIPLESLISDDEKRILAIIWSTEPMSFFDICNALRRIDMCPEKGDKKGWGQLFKLLGEFESVGYVDVERTGKSLESIQLTEKGRDLIRNFADMYRGLFKQLEREKEEFDFY